MSSLRPLAVAVMMMTGACADIAEPPDPALSEAAGYRSYVRQIEIVAMQYDTAMTAASDATCSGIYGRYSREVLIALGWMDGLAPELDVVITDHGGSGFADITCLTAALRVELDTHTAAACTATAIEDDQAETVRHLAALDSLIALALGRTDEILAGIDSGSATWTWTQPSACP